jgi:hypothetical protein
MLNKRKSTDPTVNFAVVKNPKNNEIILDFILSAEDPKGDDIVEWNAYRYAASTLLCVLTEQKTPHAARSFTASRSLDSFLTRHLRKTICAVPQREEYELERRVQRAGDTALAVQAHVAARKKGACFAANPSVSCCQGSKGRYIFAIRACS